MDADGIFRSQVFAGLWLNPVQLWNGDFAGMASNIQPRAVRRRSPRLRENAGALSYRSIKPYLPTSMVCPSGS